MNSLLFRQQSYGQPQGDQQVPPYSQPQQLKKPPTTSVKVNVALMGAIAFLFAVIISSCGNPQVVTPTPAPSPTPIPSPSPSPTSPPVSVTITYPTNGSMVPVTILVQGTASGIPQNKQLWLLVGAAGVAGYFPQIGPVQVSTNGTWSTSATLGGPNDVGKQFVLYTALVDQNDKGATDAISNYFTVGNHTHQYLPINPLPPGIQTLNQVIVVRK